MYTNLKKVNEGFTIVETLIVLAIAALIITIILIAVPDLQRSGRNSNLLHDAQNVSSSIQNFESNNDGSLPTVKASASYQSGSTITIGDNTATPSQATTTATVQGSDSVGLAAITSGTTGAIKWNNTAPTAVSAEVAPGYIYVVYGADCSSTSGQTQAAGATGLTGSYDPRAVAIYYPIEISGGGNVGCIQE
jgi:prepilin-type N-terminal cleavage/methylation domain-containing protein